MYLLGVRAAELLEWCDVPRTKEAYMAGYQRLLSDRRADEITDYLRESSQNVLPGAIIVATDREYVAIVRDNDQVFLEIADDPRNFRTKLEELFGGFSTRLSTEELRSADIQVTTSTDDDSDEQEQDESEYPRSYIASLAQELTLALQDWDNLNPERRKAIEEYIEGVSKPGLIIDGQHRVIGAKNVSDHDVTLPVIVLHGLPHEEQVFQFYVLNSKAKPLRPTELRRITSTSLTNSEIDALYQRFRTAGVDANEARWTYEMNTSPDSVFRDLLDFGFGTASAVIPENVADQLVRAFMKMPRSRYSALMDPVAGRWNDANERLRIFFDFWRAIREVYSAVWEEAVNASKKGEQRQIFTKVALLTLQRFILDRFVTALPYRSRSAPPPFATAEATKEMVQSTLANLPAEFFSREWKVKQMDTSAGRELLYAAMGQVWDNAGRNIGYMKLFRG
jgi:hypothetical protein